LAWKRLSLITEIIGEVQSRILLTGLYYTIVAPFGLLSQLISDPLHKKGEAHWVKREAVSNDIDSARGQG
jgi:hypothetical protein